MTKLFVYGSLRKGCYNHFYIEKNAEFKGIFYVKGTLFTIKNEKYPALVLNNCEKNTSDMFTVGELYEFPESKENIKKIFEDMDKMEGYYGKDNINNEYNRIYLDIYDNNYKKSDNAYVYVYNMENPLLKNSLESKIKDNDYLNVYKK
ncbi:MAG: gamma-glutamylcyclotransferase [Leptotrichiaceae bacterium]|nr:gamma-glutamylcyclotransferase [Leptotrichiaceae bacterium]